MWPSPSRNTLMRATTLAALLLIAASAASRAQADSTCGELVTIETHDRTTTRYALAHPPGIAAAEGRIALVLLAGGGGHLDLDDKGCPRALKGNSLVRLLPDFHAEGFITALVDAPSDYPGEDGLAGFRIEAQHAEDLGKIIADVRKRTNASVWLAGTSRGSISAANAAARLSGPAAPEGLVLTSVLMSGGKKGWVTQTVFNLPLESIRMPVLIVGHVDDKCVRSPAGQMESVAARTRSVRQQVVTVSGGPGHTGLPNIDACAGRAPHGYVDQEAEVAAGMARFTRGGRY